jgi:hypothetical protein
MNHWRPAIGIGYSIGEWELIGVGCRMTGFGPRLGTLVGTLKPMSGAFVLARTGQRIVT